MPPDGGGDAGPGRAVPTAAVVAPPAGREEQAPPRRWMYATVVGLLVDTVGVLPIFVTGALAVQLREDIGLSVDLLGFVSASYFGAAALLSAPLGRISERAGPETALRVGCSMYVVALVGIATLASSPAVLTAFVALSGLGTALTRTATSVLVARAVVVGRQGLAFGLKHCSIALGSLLAGASVPAIALTVGWRWVYVVAAALALAVTLMIPRRRSAAPRPPATGSADLSRRLLVVAAVGLAFGSGAASCLGVYTVSTAVDAGMPTATAGVLVAMGSVVGLASRVVVGWWSDRRTGSQLDIVEWLLLAGAVGFVLLGFGTPAVLWFAVPMAFATGWAWLGSYNLAMVRLNPVAPGAAVGVTQAGAFVGAVVGPLALGFTAEHVSFAVAWSGAAVSSFVSAVMIGSMRRFAIGERRR